MRYFLMIVLAVLEVSCATTTAPAATGNNTVEIKAATGTSTTTTDIVKKEELRVWTGYFIVEGEGKDYPTVLIYVGNQGGGNFLDWSQMMGPKDWVVYKTYYHREKGGQDVFTAEVEEPFVLLFDRVVVTKDRPIVEAQINECRLEVPVSGLEGGGQICTAGHCGRLYKAALADGIKPIVPLEKCEGLIGPAVPE